MINTIKQDAMERMQKSLESLQSELAKIRTGRAHPSLLEHVQVECYGSVMPLNQVASVNVSDARTLTLTPWDKTMLAPIEKAIMAANLGLNPATTGTIIRVPMPPLTEERRKELIKVARHEAEASRVAIRNIRRDANAQLKDEFKEKRITEDEMHRGEETHQKLTDKYIAEVDHLLTRKESDLMEV